MSKDFSHLAEYSYFMFPVPGLSELEGIEFSNLTGKLSPETFDNISEHNDTSRDNRRCLANP